MYRCRYNLNDIPSVYSMYTAPTHSGKLRYSMAHNKYMRKVRVSIRIQGNIADIGISFRPSWYHIRQVQSNIFTAGRQVFRYKALRSTGAVLLIELGTDRGSILWDPYSTHVCGASNLRRVCARNYLRRDLIKTANNRIHWYPLSNTVCFLGIEVLSINS